MPLTDQESMESTKLQILQRLAVYYIWLQADLGYYRLAETKVPKFNKAINNFAS